MSRFSQQILQWFDQEGRTDLPWQHPRSAYRVWVSEIMLQQTQVKTVIPYFETFMRRFPDIYALASAEQDDVMSCWAGLGYYARARNLHRCAKVIVEEYSGEFPVVLELLESLPGIGRSTAGAILSQAFEQRGVILDGNVKRVLSRYAAIEGWPGQASVAKQLWQLADQLMPKERYADYTQAIMDVGALICKRSKPECPHCPLQSDCQAQLLGTVELFPGKKSRKPLPTKSTRLLIIEHNQQILLEKRPPTGIWGGLWSLPEMNADCLESDIQHSVIERFGLIPCDMQQGKSFKHTFSHFHLMIEPWRLQVDSKVNKVAESQAEWVEVDRLEAFGMPRPVEQLIYKTFG